MYDAPADPYGLEGTTLQGRYAVGPAVARGGFGVVYRARQLDLDAPVAIKVLVGVEALAGDARAEALRRFREEARTLAALRHPAVARVIEFGVLARASGEVPWMALDWIDGVTLEDDLRARDGEGRSPREALALLRPAFDALACAHEVGVAHRDLKPANLMLAAARRGEAALRVIDFGVAKVADLDEGAPSGATVTRTESPAFSPRYAAPEQVGRTRTGPWTDVHALGLLVTEVLTGSPAYRSEDGPALLGEIVGADRPTPGRQGVRVGPWEVVLTRALSVVPADRPADAARLLRELEACVDEAELAWASAPRAARRPTPAAAETLAPAPRPAPVVSVSAPSPAVRAPSRGRVAAPVALAVFAALALAAALLRRPQGPSPRPERVAAPSPVAVPPPALAAPPEPPTAPPPAEVTAPRAVGIVRRPTRPAHAVRRPTDAPRPTATAPTPASTGPLPFVPIE